MTDVAVVMAELESLGTEQNRKVYARHGVTPPLFGVSYASVDALAKRLGTDHDLAVDLWATGNHDARIVATRVADPSRITATVADSWARDCGNYVEVEALAKLVGRSPVAAGRAAAWRGRKGEWVASAGWALTAWLALGTTVPDDELVPLLDQIGRDLHHRPNRVRHEMNGALIATGSRPALRERALATAAAIGPVAVDHGQTSCKTPDATAYIEKMSRRRQSKAARP